MNFEIYLSMNSTLQEKEFYMMIFQNNLIKQYMNATELRIYVHTQFGNKNK